MSLTVKFRDMNLMEDGMSPSSTTAIMKATRHDKLGVTCGFCGSANDYATEAGWYYINPYNESVSRPACWKCINSEKGILHRARMQKHVKLRLR